MSPAIIIADPHVSRHPEKNQILQSRLEGIFSAFPGHTLVVAGDVTDDSAQGQYVEALRLFAPWKGNILLCPGNHDFGAMGLFFDQECVSRWSDFCVEIEAEAEGVFLGEGVPWKILCLDSCSAFQNPFNWAQGELGCSELGVAAIAIAKAHRIGQRICLVLHHDPLNTDVTMLLRDRNDFIRIAAEADLVVFGHTHRMWEGKIGDTPYRSLDSFRESNEGDYLILPR